MVAHEEGTDTNADDDLDDVVVVTSLPEENDRRPSHPAVTSAVRYLLNRHELSTGQPAPQMIAVVSAVGGEGVTTVSRSLAGILSTAAWSNVCWMDLAEIDLTVDEGAPELSPVRERPALSRADRIGRPQRKVSDLDRRQGGRVTAASPQGTVALAKFEELLSKLSDEYRHIIFDTPPLLADPDALGFMRYADAYIIVTRHGVTTRADIRRVSNELRTIPSLGAILNDYHSRTPKAIRRLFAE